MLDARKYALEAMMNGMPFIVIPETAASKRKRYSRYVWMERGEVLFSEEAFLDHLAEYGILPRERYFDGDPNEPF